MNNCIGPPLHPKIQFYQNRGQFNIVPGTFKTEPYIHQKAGILTCYKQLINYGFSGLLMDMGTGKTKTSLNTLELLFRENKIDRIIIVCPKALINVWKDEIKTHTFFYSHSVFLWNNQKVKTKKYNRLFKSILEAKTLKIKIFIINIEAFQTKSLLLKEFLDQFKSDKNAIILDESSKIKNIKANRTVNLIKNTHSIKYKIILTGTEITNSILDLYSQFLFLKKDFWRMRNYGAFRNRYAILKSMETIEGKKIKTVVGYKKIDELIAKVKPYIFRAIKKDCLDLPDKIYQTIKIEMNKDQKEVYKTLKNNLIAAYGNKEIIAINKISLFSKFRQITGGFVPGFDNLIGNSNPKLDVILEDSENYTGKIIIWCSFIKEIEYICNKLKNRSVTYYGKINQEQRDQNLKEFKNNPDIKYLIINPQCGAYGLNLQFCHLVYYFSRTLSPEENWQSEDRTHRIGLKDKVLYKSVVCENTVDEKILSSLTKKTDLRNLFREMTTNDFFNLI